jgi:hypothetical protein
LERRDDDPCSWIFTQEEIMKTIVAALLLAGSILAIAGPSPAAARDYPYCLQGRDYGYPGNCQFTGYQQCMATASGTLSYCGITPRAAFAQQRPRYQDRSWGHEW